MSSADQTVPLGLCGELTMIARVRGPSAAAMRVEVGPEGAAACSGTCTGAAAGQLDVRAVAVVARVEHDHLVAGADEGEHGGEDRLRRAGGDGDLARRVVAMAVERLDLGGDALAQERHAGHRRVLVEAAAHRRVDGVDQRRVAVEIGEALAEIDGAVLQRQRRHHGEDGRADVRAGGSTIAGVRGGAASRARMATRSELVVVRRRRAIARSTSGAGQAIGQSSRRTRRRSCAGRRRA